MRLFVAVWPTPAVVEELGALPRPAAPGLRWTTADQWHVTLRFLGDADPGEAADAVSAVVHRPSRPRRPAFLLVHGAGGDLDGLLLGAAIGDFEGASVGRSLGNTDGE